MTERALWESRALLQRLHEREQSCQASVFETRTLISSSRECLRDRAVPEVADAAGVHAAGEEFHGSSNDRG